MASKDTIPTRVSFFRSQLRSPFALRKLVLRFHMPWFLLWLTNLQFRLHPGYPRGATRIDNFSILSPQTEFGGVLRSSQVSKRWIPDYSLQRAERLLLPTRKYWYHGWPRATSCVNPILPTTLLHHSYRHPCSFVSEDWNMICLSCPMPVDSRLLIDDHILMGSLVYSSLMWSDDYCYIRKNLSSIEAKWHMTKQVIVRKFGVVLRKWQDFGETINPVGKPCLVYATPRGLFALKSTSANHDPWIISATIKLNQKACSTISRLNNGELPTIPN